MVARPIKAVNLARVLERSIGRARMARMAKPTARVLKPLRGRGLVNLQMPLIGSGPRQTCDASWHQRWHQSAVLRPQRGGSARCQGARGVRSRQKRPQWDGDPRTETQSMTQDLAMRTAKATRTMLAGKTTAACCDLRLVRPEVTNARDSHLRRHPFG